MGYHLSVNINTFKAVDYSNLSGVSLTVYHEGENLSIMSLTTDADGWVYQDLDRSTWPVSDTLRVKAYFEKDGYIKGCAKLNYEGSFTDENGVVFHSYSGTLLLIEAPSLVPLQIP